MSKCKDFQANECIQIDLIKIVYCKVAVDAFKDICTHMVLLLLYYSLSNIHCVV